MNTTQPTAETTSKLRTLTPYLLQRIRGQDHVIPRIVSLLRRGELGLTKPGRPRGSFLFLGPTGVGKTATALAFTTHLMGADHLFRFDMSEYQTQESLRLLLGDKADEGGMFGMLWEKAQYGTILFDEIEKSHPRVMDIFLQLLDAARLTLANGKTLDLSGFYVVFTSNIGSADLMKLEHSADTTVQRHVLSLAQQSLRPELYARITEKLVFNKLTYDIQLEIARSMLEEELEFLNQKGHPLVAAERVLPFLVRCGFDSKLGARPMRDAVEKQIGDAVAANVLAGGTGGGTLVEDATANRLAIR